MKSSINCVLLLLALVTGLYSCRPDQIPQIPIPDDKLLLSQYNQQIDYVEDGYSDVLNQSYTYGPRQGNLFFSSRPLTSVQFPDFGASAYTYTYQNNRPFKVIDNRNPGVDQGYWKFYYDNFNRIAKVGLAYQLSAEPTVFDFFDYNSRGNVEYAYRGETSTNPDFYVKYLYSGNDLKGYDYYGKPQTLTKTSKDKIKLNAARPGQSGYIVYLHVDITSDNKNNPFSQQGKLLFYPSNSPKGPFGGDLSDAYITLMDHNPLTVTYHFNEAVFGPDVTLTETFTYTYNQKKYPITGTNTISDPTYALTGSINKILHFAYIPN